MLSEPELSPREKAILREERLAEIKRQDEISKAAVIARNRFSREWDLREAEEEEQQQ